MSEGRKAGSAAQRQQRLGAALRENLKRRKAQARGRAAPSQTPEDRVSAETEERGNKNRADRD